MAQRTRLVLLTLALLFAGESVAVNLRHLETPPSDAASLDADVVLRNKVIL